VRSFRPDKDGAIVEAGPIGAVFGNPQHPGDAALRLDLTDHIGKTI
jgi:hypothetical protein